MIFFQNPIFAILAAVVVLALVLLLTARILLRRSGISSGRIVYSDHARWRRVEKPLYDGGLGLTGKPDYLIRQEGKLVPAEVKSSYAPSSPYDSHIMQLAAYCMLVDRNFGERPPYGLLRYRNRTFKIPFTPQLEQEVLDLIGTIRATKDQDDVPRSHSHQSRCARCGFRNSCDQRL